MNITDNVIRSNNQYMTATFTTANSLGALFVSGTVVNINNVATNETVTGNLIITDGAASYGTGSGSLMTTASSTVIGAVSPGIGIIGQLSASSGLIGNLDIQSNVIGVSGIPGSTVSNVYMTNLNSQWIQFGNKIVGTGYSGGGSQGFGNSNSLSRNGLTFVTGTVNDFGTRGATYVFIKTGNNWVQQGDKLVGSGYSSTAASQGISTSVSADGNTFATGAWFDSNFGIANVGSTWIFVRSTNNTWNQQGSKLVGTGFNGGSQQGNNGMAMSADGNILLVAGIADNSSTGAVWCFMRSGTSWSQVGNKIVGSPAGSNMGTGIDINPEGTIFTAGVSLSSIAQVYVFVRSTGNNFWSQQAVLLGTGYSTPNDGAYGVNLSLNSNTIVYGGRLDNANRGAIWVFVRTGTTGWIQQGNKLVGSGFSGNSLQGVAITNKITTTGDIIISGGSGDNNGQLGAIWVFTRTNGVWTQLGNKLIGTGYTTNSGFVTFGQGLVSIPGTVFISGYNDFAAVGANWVFSTTKSTSANLYNNGIFGSNGFAVYEGLLGNGGVSAAKQGLVTLTNGSATVSNTSVTANSRIFLTTQSNSGTVGFVRVKTRTAGSTFIIQSSSGTDTSTVAFEMFEPLS